MVPNLRFYRESGTAKLCEVTESYEKAREVPIAEVPPPDYLAPPKKIFVQ